MVGVDGHAFLRVGTHPFSSSSPAVLCDEDPCAEPHLTPQASGAPASFAFSATSGKVRAETLLLGGAQMFYNGNVGIQVDASQKPIQVNTGRVLERDAHWDFCSPE